MELKNRIAEQRTKLGWSQEKLAREAQLSRMTVINMESGKDGLMSNFKHVAEAMGLTVNDLFYP